MKIKIIDFGYKKAPYRAHANDAGADVYAMTERMIFPQEIVKFPLGFGLVLPDGYMACIYPRSSLASKGVVCEIPPIDAGFRGEICAIVANNSDKAVKIFEGDRIGQIVITPVIIADFIKDDIEQRGEGGFGSTGK